MTYNKKGKPVRASLHYSCKYYNKMVVVKSGKYNCQYKQVCQV